MAKAKKSKSRKRSSTQKKTRTRRKKRSSGSTGSKKSQQNQLVQTMGFLIISLVLASVVGTTGLVTLSSAVSQPYKGKWEVNNNIKRDAIRVNNEAVDTTNAYFKDTEWGYQHVTFDVDPTRQKIWDAHLQSVIDSGYHDYFGTADLDISIGDPENYIFSLDSAEWQVADDDMSYRIIEKAVTSDNLQIARYNYKVFRFWANAKTAGDKVDRGLFSGWHGEASGSWGVTAELNARIHFSLDGWRIANQIEVNGSTYVHDTSQNGWAGVMSAYIIDHGYVGVIRDSDNNMGQWNSDAPIARILNAKNSKPNMYTENNSMYYGYDDSQLYAIQDVPSAVDLEFTVELLPAAYANWFGTARTEMQIVNVEASLQFEVHVVTLENYVLVTGDPPVAEIENTYFEPPPPNWMNDSWSWMVAQMWDPLGDFMTKMTMLIIVGILGIAIIAIVVLILYLGIKKSMMKKVGNR